ncbi:hypothetical protein F0L68_07090 [Solihabitans fulvus]|uniref:DUF5666 domain-containing protein n=1 Tax=Solihabitans fulvus TaxID=1892852 RepID=A0A5B2XPF2_9PSEU|nr:DUF5666 domain-containing protein [Solihabitans fulvus]KAA2264834.1 hypothetical protein F0L68_07090 [Solihabitans fulvus]
MSVPSSDVPPPTSDAEKLLAQPAKDGNLDAELAARRPVSKLTIGLGIVVLVVVAFVGGIFTNQALGSSSSSSNTAQGQGQGRGGYNGTRPSGSRPSGTRPSGAPGQGQGRGGTVGTIDHVDGNTVYVKRQDGTVVKVTTSDSTKVELTAPGALTDLKAGDPVAVQGQPDQSGAVTANTIIRQAPQG